VGILEGAEPYFHDGGDTGVLLCHGFTGTPQSLRGWAEHLATAGYTVRLPLLPGHGTTWQDMNRTTWPDWYGSVEAELVQLSARCSSVAVAGLSMGGCLALRLAIDHPDAVDGLVLVNPAVRLEHPLLVALPVLHRVVPSFPGIASDIKRPGVSELAYDRTPLRALASSLRMYADTREKLKAVTQPVLLFRSAVDHVVPASSSRLILDSISSTQAEEVICQDSYHVATLDNDAPMIFERSAGFLAALAALAAPSAAESTPPASAGGPR